MLTDAELDQCIAELERFIAEDAAAERAAPGARPTSVRPPSLDVRQLRSPENATISR
jgi:hypothetical protein